MGQYVPTLRSKEGELKALKNLKPESYKKLIPFFKITGPDFDRDKKEDKKTLEKHLADVADKISKNCADVPLMYIDFDFHKEDLCDELHYADFFFSTLATLGIRFCPVTGLERVGDAAFQNSIKSTISTYDTNVAIRLDRDDLELMETYGEDLVSLVDFMGVDKESVHLLFDMKSVLMEEVTVTSEVILNAIGHIEDFDSYASVSIISGGMPLTMSAFPTNAVSKHPRADWNLWKNCKKKINRPLNFGDYGIVSPEPSDVDPRIMNRTSRIRYTEQTEWKIFKGHSLKTTGGAIQNPKLASMVVADKVYRGEAFSFGDAYIKKCAHKLVIGNATSWVTADMNQHFEMVISQLST